MIKKDVKINLTNDISNGKNTEKYSSEQIGKAIIINNILYLKYNESDAPFFPVIFKINNTNIKLKRGNQKTNSHFIMEFNNKKPTLSYYYTPYGKIFFKVKTNKIFFKLKNSPLSGMLKLKYQLFDYNEIVGNYKLVLYFKELS